MSLFKDLISQIDPSAAYASPPVTNDGHARSSQSPVPAPRPTPRPAVAAVGASQPPLLKRKASGPVDGSQVKVQRKDAPTQPTPANDAARPAPQASATKPKPATPSASIPYRGTAGLGASKPANAPVKKPSPTANTPISAPKAPASVAKPAASTSGAAAPAPAKKMGHYAALLAKAKEKEQTKPAAAPIKHEAPIFLKKKERQQARQEGKIKGKKPGAVAPTRAGPVPGSAVSAKADAGNVKRKPAELGYQGTARPAKKPVEIGYKGTARPSSAAPAGKPGASTAKGKARQPQGRYGGYASWSEEELEEEEEDYQSDASSDMEAGTWDVEEEEQLALKVAKKEDAEALAEEAELKRQKEERKRKLQALQKQAAAKRR